MKMEIQEEIVKDIDLPDNYYTTCTFEDAGGGMVRVSRYVKKRGILIPVVNTISAAEHLVQFGQDVSIFARRVMIKRAEAANERLPGCFIH